MVHWHVRFSLVKRVSADALAMSIDSCLISGDGADEARLPFYALRQRKDPGTRLQ